MRKFPFIIFSFFLLLTFCCKQIAEAQVVAGPMPGMVELRTAKIWVEVKPGNTVSCWYWKKAAASEVKRLDLKTDPGQWYTPVVFDLVNLEVNTSYDYAITVNSAASKRPTHADGSFQTQDLWQWRKPAPDFSFLTGSCAYFNEPVYDRPGKPYGQDSSIFLTMANEKASFMLWLGDNWYTREADYFSRWGLWYRAHHDRSLPILQPFLKAMPQYAIWDDHDYGPNNGDKSFIYKDESLDIFKHYWANPSYGQDGRGIFTKFSYSDCDFFLMDDRSFRDADDMEPYVYGKPNPEKRMWGKKQIEWLKNALIQSTASFKFIVTGSQTLNVLSPFDCLQHYPVEFQELLSFLSGQHISGVIFLTGDRHHSEVVRYERNSDYPLYDITSSPLTSGVGKVFGKELKNPWREAGTLVEAQNYSRISVSGKKGERVLKVEFIGLKGDRLGEWSIGETALKSGKNY
ncbi:MAG TPA: alkaline phosphatase D family protein [Chitinophagaceae bacterium]|nr:alkaline phosphatase D family protein [Chitinophagaceae bacterium]